MDVARILVRGRELCNSVGWIGRLYGLKRLHFTMVCPIPQKVRGQMVHCYITSRAMPLSRLVMLCWFP